jgi:hypothetical protein
MKENGASCEWSVSKVLETKSKINLTDGMPRSAQFLGNPEERRRTSDI